MMTSADTSESLVYVHEDDTWTAINTNMMLLPPPLPLDTKWDEYCLSSLCKSNWFTGEFPYILYLICHLHLERPILQRLSEAKFLFVRDEDGWFMRQELRESWEMAESCLLGQRMEQEAHDQWHKAEFEYQ